MGSVSLEDEKAEAPAPAPVSAALDFLGAVDNKKLVPAVSAFRRLLKKSSRVARQKPPKEADPSEDGGSCRPV
ncbi:unnamed protein product [Effrenium voratum]|uniref:Uncharacterized protein n=1 Tax=Effrenium voratum TaxID=2562239 RepID=A0AA36N4F8_9DINO|nr:unnamed protein product [Effrenium voratum]